MRQIVPQGIRSRWKHGLPLGVTAKLVWAFILTNGAVLLGMVIFLHWHFGRGFLDYLAQTEIRHLDGLRTVLAQQYAAEGDWQFLRRDHRRWWHMVDDIYGPRTPGRGLHPPSDHPRPPHEASSGRAGLDMGQHHPSPHPPMPPHETPAGGRPDWRPHRPPPPPGDLLHLARRLSVLDAEQRLVVGEERDSAQATLRPIQQGDQVVGWLRLIPLPSVTDELDRRFLRQQSQAFSLIAVVVLALAVGVSCYLARHFLAPVTELSHGTRALMAGRFGTRLRVTARDALGQLARDFNTLAHTLEHNEQARRQMTADIAHELRTPLAILRGEIEALADGVRPCDTAALQSLHTEALTLHTLVDDLYQLSLSDLGALTYRAGGCGSGTHGRPKR